MSQLESAEFIVIGGGLLGSSAAFHLASRGARVIVLEAGGIAGEASGANSGFVWIQGRAPGADLTLASHSAQAYKEFEERIGVDPEFLQCGGLSVAETPAQAVALRAFLNDQKRVGAPIEWVDRGDLLKMEPLLAPSVCAGTYGPEDGNVNPLRVVAGYHRALRHRGGKSYFHAPVRDFEVGAGRISAAVTPRGRFGGDWYILAAGPWTASLAEKVGVRVPVRPNRLHNSITRALPRGAVRTTLNDARYLAYRFPEAFEAGEHTDDFHVTIGIRQAADGGLLIGWTGDFSGFRTAASSRRLRHTFLLARKMVPALGDVDIVRTWARLKTDSPDGEAIFGLAPGVSNLFLATATGEGATFAPGLGAMTADSFFGGPLAQWVEGMRIERFPPDSELSFLPRI